MSIVKISDLPAATSPVSSSDVVPVVQNGVTKKSAIDQLGFIGAGANASPRTIQSKLRDTISVKDFGAVGDGTTDDTAAIQATIDYAKSSGGNKTIEFPSATYRVTAPIVINGNFNFGLVIKGNKSVISSTHNGIVFSCNSGIPTPAPAFRLNLAIYDLTIYGPGKANTNSVGVQLYGANYALNNVIIYNFYIALYGKGCLISEFVQCKFEQSQIGVFFQAFDGFSPNDIHFIKCNIIVNTQAVKFIDFDYGAISFIGCEIEGNNLSGNATDGVKVCEFAGSGPGLGAGEVTFVATHFEANPGQYNLYYDSPPGRHLNIIGGKMVPGDTTGSVVYVNYGELYVTGSHIAQNIGGNIVLTANTSSAVIVGDTAGLVTGTTTKLVRITQGRVNAGGANPGAANPALAGKGTLGVGALVEGSIQFNNSSGTRLGTIASNSITLDASAQYTLTTGRGSFFLTRSSTELEPGADTTYNLGSGSLRWNTVYAVTPTINTSDEREKQQIGEIPQAWLDAWEDVEYVRFKFNDAVEKKGDGARWHVGLVAQRIKNAFESRGINPFEIGLLCYDEWNDVEIDSPLKDENGNFVIDAETGEIATSKKLVKSAGNLYGIRYEEALALECAYLRSKLNGAKNG